MGGTPSRYADLGIGYLADLVFEMFACERFGSFGLALVPGASSALKTYRCHTPVDDPCPLRVQRRMINNRRLESEHHRPKYVGHGSHEELPLHIT